MDVSTKNVHLDKAKIQYQKNIMATIKQKNELESEKTGRKKYGYIETYGCQQNENDSEKIRGMLYEMGYYPTDNKEEADIILYNTCCVRENAELKVYGNVGALKHFKKKKPDTIIGICGCMMQQEHVVEKIKKSYRHVDLIFGTHTIYKLPELIYKVLSENIRAYDVIDTDGYIIEDMPVKRDNNIKAWISIMYGCNNFCTYCIVPYVRGRERSRNPEDVMDEVNMLAKDGYKEIMLLGQNVNSYGKTLNEDIDFADLLKRVNDVKGIERIRFMTSHPKDISDKLIKTIADCEKVCEQLHLPIQAGSNKVLRRMNRGYDKERYLDIISKLKKEVPNIALSGDIIVGFPGETNEDFEETLEVVKKVQYDLLYMFIYSPRVGTPASKYEDTMTDEEKHINFDKLMKVQHDIAYKKNLEYVGKEVEVLVEGYSRNNKDILTGRTRTNKVVNFTGPEDSIGKLVNVYINEAKSFFITGKVI